jgi:polypyrimidine tract-binding protein 2
MVSYFASSSEPAQIRGKTVYIQYSNRQEIINNRSPGETSGNVLLVTIEGVQASDVTIDVIHMVSSRFIFFLYLVNYLYDCVSTVMRNNVSVAVIHND